MDQNGKDSSGPDMTQSFVVTGDPGDWRPEVTAGTDAQGWRYGRMFPSSENLLSTTGSTEGGLPTKPVRWRKWQKGGLDTPESSAHTGERWENQRWWVGAGWVGASPITSFKEDPHNWTDAQTGHECKPADPATWTVVLGDSVDAEGWEFATSFGSLKQRPTREGGRAANRTTDQVRRRRWVEFGSELLVNARQEKRLAVTQVAEVCVWHRGWRQG